MGDACDYICGDADGSGDVNIADLTYIVAYIFQGGPEPVKEEAADVDKSGNINVADLTGFVAFIFEDGSIDCP